MFGLTDVDVEAKAVPCSSLCARLLPLCATNILLSPRIMAEKKWGQWGVQAGEIGQLDSMYPQSQMTGQTNLRQA
jgi:hypothetical protein